MDRSGLIADAVVHELGTHTFSPAIDVARVYQPVYELEELTGNAKVSVIGGGLEVDDASRAAFQEDHEIHVVVQKKLAGVTPSDVDPLAALAEQVADFLSGRTLSQLPGVAFLKVQRKPIYEPEHLKKWRQYTAVIAITYRGLVDSRAA